MKGQSRQLGINRCHGDKILKFGQSEMRKMGWPLGRPYLDSTTNP
jgi:hypothetical protein